MKIEPRISIITLGVSSLPESIGFYRDGLGFETEAEDNADIAFFKTMGTRFALYPFDKLVEDINPGMKASKPAFTGITLAHNTRKREDVDNILALAEQSGGKIIKPAQDVFWGGYSGYFTDPDGYFWEVAHADFWQFNEDGSLVL